MKKLLCTALSVLLCLSLAACGSGSSASSASAASEESATMTTAAPTAASSVQVSESVSVAESVTEAPSSEADSVLASVVESAAPSPSAPPASAGVLSDSLYDFQVELDGQVIDFPLTYEAFSSYGFTCAEDDTQTISANRYTYVQFRYKGAVSAMVYLANPGNSDVPLTQCVATGIEIDSSSFGSDSGVSIVLPGGLDFYSLTKEQAEAAYGAPTESTETGDVVSLRYALNLDDTVTFSFYEGAIGNYTIRTMTIPDDLITTAPVNMDTPSIVTDYVAPTALSANLADYTFSYAGALYQLPAPVQSFVDNGWTIVEQDSDATIAGKNAGWVSLQKDNQVFRTLASNYTSSEVPAVNCFVTEIDSHEYGPNVEMELSGGIKMGMAQSELEAALAGMTVEQSQSGETTYYDLKLDPPNIITTVSIMVRGGVVTGIELDHTPNFSEFGD